MRDEKGEIQVKRKMLSFCLTIPEHELKKIREKADEAGISVSRFFRMAALGEQLKQPITADIPVLINEVRRAETELDKLLDAAGPNELIDKEKIEDMLKHYIEVEKLIREAYEQKWQ